MIGISSKLWCRKVGGQSIAVHSFCKKKKGVENFIHIPHVRDDLISSGIVSVQIIPYVISGPFTVGALKTGANTPHIEDIDYSIPGARDEDRSGSYHARGQGTGLRALQC